MDYETARSLVGIWGLIGFVVMFAGVVVYALWPRNREKFRHAAQIPLKED